MPVIFNPSASGYRTVYFVAGCQQAQQSCKIVQTYLSPERPYLYFSASAFLLFIAELVITFLIINRPVPLCFASRWHDLQARSCASASSTLDGTPRLSMLSWRAQRRSLLKQECPVLLHESEWAIRRADDGQRATLRSRQCPAATNFPTQCSKCTLARKLKHHRPTRHC